MPTRDRFVHWGITLLLFCGCASAWAQRVPSPDDPKAVVAETQQNAKRQGMLRTGRITWKCSGKLCIATSKRVAVGVNTCQALAELVGSLSRFGRVERPIASHQLALCNVRAQIRLAKLEQQRADAEAARVRRHAARKPPAGNVAASSPGASASTAAPGEGTAATWPGGGAGRLSGPKPLPRGVLPGSADGAPSPPRAAAAVIGAGPATAGTSTAATGAPPAATSASSSGSAAPAASPRRGPVSAARGTNSARRPPPVVEISPIAPSYRPSIFAIHVTPLAVVGRGSIATDVEPGSSAGMSLPSANPSVSSSSSTSSSVQSAASAATLSAASAPELSTVSAPALASTVAPTTQAALGAGLPGASSSPDALPSPASDLRPAADFTGTNALGTDLDGARGVPGSAQSSLRDDAGKVAAAPSLPGSASAPSGTARPARAALGPVVVPGLAIVGHGRMQEPVQGTHLTVTVDRLEVIGKREGDE